MYTQREQFGVTSSCMTDPFDVTHHCGCRKFAMLAQRLIATLPMAKGVLLKVWLTDKFLSRGELAITAMFRTAFAVRLNRASQLHSSCSINDTILLKVGRLRKAP